MVHPLTKIPLRLTVDRTNDHLLALAFGHVVDGKRDDEYLHLSDAAALLLFMLVSPAFTWIIAPLLSAWSRRHEYEADAFAAQHSDARALAAALVRLYKDNASTLTPDPVYSAFHDSHPPPTARVARLNQLALQCASKS